MQVFQKAGGLQCSAGEENRFRSEHHGKIHANCKGYSKRVFQMDEPSPEWKDAHFSTRDHIGSSLTVLLARSEVPAFSVHGGAVSVRSGGSAERVGRCVWQRGMCFQKGNCSFFWDICAGKRTDRNALPEPWLERRLRTPCRLPVSQIALFSIFRAPLTEPAICRVRPATGTDPEGTSSCAKRGMECPSVCTTGTPGSFRPGMCTVLQYYALVPVGVSRRALEGGKCRAGSTLFLSSFEATRCGINSGFLFRSCIDNVFLFGRDCLNKAFLAHTCWPRKGARILLRRGPRCRRILVEKKLLSGLGGA